MILIQNYGVESEGTCQKCNGKGVDMKVDPRVVVNQGGWSETGVKRHIKMGEAERETASKNSVGIGKYIAWTNFGYMGQSL